VPNILKRPMFKRGGSTNSGITSGMEPRRNFAENGAAQNQTNPELERMKAAAEYVKRQKQQMEPTGLQRIGDFLTAFGAGADPKQPQTVAEALGAGAKGYAALSAQRDARKDKYGQALDQQLLKMFAGDKAGANSFIKTLKARAENAVRQGKYPNYQAAYDALFEPTFNEIYGKQRATKSFADKVSDKAKIILANEELKTSPLAGRAATIAVKIDEGEIKIPGGYVGFVKATKAGESDIVPQGDGKTAVANTKKTGYKPNIFESNYQIGQNYIDPISQGVYQYQGKGTFKRVYP